MWVQMKTNGLALINTDQVKYVEWVGRFMTIHFVDGDKHVGDYASDSAALKDYRDIRKAVLLDSVSPIEEE